MGWDSCEVWHKDDMLRLCNRLIDMPDNRLSTGIFLIIIFWQEKLQKYSVRQESIIFFKLPCNVSQIKLILFENYKQKWSEDILCEPKLKTYRLIKSLFQPEPCVTLNLSRAQRSVCAQVRCATLRLAVETGHFTQFQRTECITCVIWE